VGVGVGDGVGVGVGVGVATGCPALGTTTFTPLPHTFFFPCKMHLYLKPFAIDVAPTVLQEAPVLTAPIAGVIQAVENKAAIANEASAFFMYER
jgi:hypothetical protein